MGIEYQIFSGLSNDFSSIIYPVLRRLNFLLPVIQPERESDQAGNDGDDYGAGP